MIGTGIVVSIRHLTHNQVVAGSSPAGPGTEEQATLSYMTDGGSENKRIASKVTFAVNHLVAWKNIRSSNSMIERVFHTMKNEYKYILYCR